jgi:ATP-dependent DNA ligase
MQKKRLELGYFLNEAEIDDPVYFKPMLAHKLDDYINDLNFNDDIFSQKKLDGLRCVAHSGGLFSRNGKQFLSTPHIFDALKPLFEADPSLVLDGELFVDKNVADFNEIISCVRKSKPTLSDIMESRKIQYWVYDLPSSSNIFSKRFEELIKLQLPSCCVKVDTRRVKSKNDIKKFYEEYIEQGYEGQMIRLDKEYQNKRSKYLLKDKCFLDEEFEIIGYEEGKGKLMNRIGKLKFKTKEGNLFDSAVNGTHQYLYELFQNKDNLVGKMATVKFFEWTTEQENGTGKVPRFPKCIAIRDYE